jgi:predicted RNA-binding protein with PUA-like domain
VTRWPRATKVLFYHSSCEEPGIVGIAEVCKLAYPDETQFDKKSPYYDEKSTRDNPRWLHVDVKFVKKTRTIACPSCARTKHSPTCAYWRAGNRLSITAGGSCRVGRHQ